MFEIVRSSRQSFCFWCGRESWLYRRWVASRVLTLRIKLKPLFHPREIYGDGELSAARTPTRRIGGGALFSLFKVGIRCVLVLSATTNIDVARSGRVLGGA